MYQLCVYMCQSFLQKEKKKVFSKECWEFLQTLTLVELPAINTIEVNISQIKKLNSYSFEVLFYFLRDGFSPLQLSLFQWDWKPVSWIQPIFLFLIFSYKKL